MRAERKCGELLAAADKNTGAKGIGPIAVAASDRNTPTLADMGITKDPSSRYQSLASVSEAPFETAVATADSARFARLEKALLSAAASLVGGGRIAASPLDFAG